MQQDAFPHLPEFVRHVRCSLPLYGIAVVRIVTPNSIHGTQQQRGRSARRGTQR